MLREWTKPYIKFQDCMRKKILSIEDTSTGYYVKEKDCEKEYIIKETLDFDYESHAERIIIITKNTEENVARLIKEWKTIKDRKNLTLYFVNTKKNEKWHIQPYHHHNIAEHIKESIHTLAAGVSYEY